MSVATVPATTTAGHTIAPTRAAERIQTIDILRGFALFGILLVNFEFFSHSYYDYIFGMDVATTADQWARYFIQFFAEGKFYSMFAFLFGAGMAIVQIRCAARGVPFVPLYTRRLLALLGFGLIHAYLLWFGDILIAYSVIGFLTLWLLRNTPPRRLVKLALLFLLIPIVINALLLGLTVTGSAALGPEVYKAEVMAQMEAYRAQDALSDAAYGQGSYLDTVRDRVRVMSTVFATMPFMIFNVWAMFTLGYAAGKSRLHERLADEKPLLRKVLLWGLLIGVIGNLIFVVGSANSTRAFVDGVSWLATTAQTIGAPALSLAYMAGFALLALRPRWQRRLSPLAATGRMALTNYIAQTLIMTTLMYGYGFGLYGMGHAAGLGLVVAVWALEVLWSVLWLRRFRFGPLEWLWRTITYWQPQPMRVRRTA